MCKTVTLSTLPKTWILDLDGTLVRHNGYKLDGRDTLLPGAGEFLKNIGPRDMVILVTSRTEAYRAQTEAFLREQGVRYDAIVFGAPYGERILINDRKPSGLPTAVAVNVGRDQALDTIFKVDETL